MSTPSSHRLYEEGLCAVASDTVCFPAKLVHGHIRSLAKMHVDRIFMPSITSVQSENSEKTSEWMCAIVKGYPLVIKNSDNPEHVFGIPFDDPLFHWYTTKDRDAQLTDYIKAVSYTHLIVFEGGPLTFNPKLVDVFSERLNLTGEECLIPEHPEIMVCLLYTSRCV